jgi:hypothetical protein
LLDIEKALASRDGANLTTTGAMEDEENHSSGIGN